MLYFLIQLYYKGRDKMNWVVWLIIACEIGFWVFIISGLFVRYILKKQTLGLFLLAMSPVVDFILLVATAYDLYQGATATIAHGLAAVYIGVSVVFGKSMIQWADERFQYYVFKTGEKPKQKYGLEYAKHYFKGWIKHIYAYLIGAGLVGIVYLWIQDFERTQKLLQIISGWTIVIIIDLLISLSYFIFPRKP